VNVSMLGHCPKECNGEGGRREVRTMNAVLYRSENVTP
jgi:hypothetical protein